MRAPTVIALLSVLTIAVPTPVRACYMDMGGERIDLSHMCGDGSGSTPAPAPAAEPTPPAREEPAYIRREDLASFQVIRINSNGEATGRVSFTRSAPQGATVRAYVRFMDGTRRYVGRATRTRGQRRIEIQFWLPPGTSVSEVEGGV
ncbi:hypothetical protein, partial [Leptolyngbya sp. Heron Island J]